MTRAIHSVELPGGPRLQYVEQGERSGMPLVLLHGYTDSWRSFELVLPYLPPDVRATVRMRITRIREGEGR